MEELDKIIAKSRRRRILEALLLGAVGILLNFLGARLVLALGLPIYLDCLGTFLTAAIGGYLPGMIVGYLTNLLLGINDPITIYYGLISVLIAAFVSAAYRRGWLRRVGGVIGMIVILALIGGGLGSVLTWALSGMSFGTGVTSGLVQRLYDAGFRPFLAQLTADLLLDLLDKTILTLLGLLILRLLPQAFKRRLELRGWRQKPMDQEKLKVVRRSPTRKWSLRFRLLCTISLSMIFLVLVCVGICFIQFHGQTISSQVRMAQGVANAATDAFDPDRVEEYMTLGEAAPGYVEAEQIISSLRNSSPDIEYIYVYQILEDGCHVVFDPDTEDTPGGDPGEVMPFDESFAESIPKLISGQEIEPMVTNDTFGWLLTVYRPVHDSTGRCVCYTGVDISMAELLRTETVYLSKTLALFIGFFVLILALLLWQMEYSIVLPINSMAMAAGAFAFDQDSTLDSSVENIRSLHIRTGDEIENLYHAFTKTSSDMVHFVKDVEQKNETISRMQNSLIAVLADMVESRDKFTGDHVRKTAAYARIIMEEMRREGVNAEKLTDEYIFDVVHSAPLHDVGKIKVSDALLNKPGRLTDEEYVQMKNHTLVGREIIARSIDAVSESAYLDEAQNLAAYHHERWDGKGYPFGIAGEEIPLSARVMAVADVFDALVSRRSYKEGFPIEKAMDIIRNGIGSQFDPQVAQAFLNAEAEVRRVAEEHKRIEDADEAYRKSPDNN